MGLHLELDPRCCAAAAHLFNTSLPHRETIIRSHVHTYGQFTIASYLTYDCRGICIVIELGGGLVRGEWRIALLSSLQDGG